MGLVGLHQRILPATICDTSPLPLHNRVPGPLGLGFHNSGLRMPTCKHAQPRIVRVMSENSS